MPNKEAITGTEPKFPLTRTEIILSALFGTAIGLMIVGGAVTVTS